MQKFILRVRRFLESEDGPTAVEYAVMFAHRRRLLDDDPIVGNQRERDVSVGFDGHSDGE
jgi:hypothetical protein